MKLRLIKHSYIIVYNTELIYTYDYSCDKMSNNIPPRFIKLHPPAFSQDSTGRPLPPLPEHPPRPGTVVLVEPMTTSISGISGGASARSTLSSLESPQASPSVNAAEQQQMAERPKVAKMKTAPVLWAVIRHEFLGYVMSFFVEICGNWSWWIWRRIFVSGF